MNSGESTFCSVFLCETERHLFKGEQCPILPRSLNSKRLPRLIDGSVLPGCTVRLSLSPQQVAPSLLSCHRWRLPVAGKRKLGGGFGSRQAAGGMSTHGAALAGQGFKGSRVWGGFETGRRATSTSFLGHPPPTHMASRAGSICPDGNFWSDFNALRLVTFDVKAMLQRHLFSFFLCHSSTRGCE